MSHETPNLEGPLPPTPYKLSIYTPYCPYMVVKPVELFRGLKGGPTPATTCMEGSDRAR